jgi:hypothetical protein
MAWSAPEPETSRNSNFTNNRTMKNTLLFFLTAPLLVFAQFPGNRAIHIRNETPQKILAAHNMYYFAVHTKGNTHFDTTRIYAYRKTGQQLFTKLITTDGYAEITDMIGTIDNQVLLTGWFRYCDFIDTSCKHFILKMDTTGGTVFHTSFQPIYSMAGSTLMRVAEAADSSYYVINDSVVYHFSKTGVLVNRKNFGVTEWSAISRLGNSAFLACGKLAGSFAHRRFDTAFALSTVTLGAPAPVRGYFDAGATQKMAVLSNGDLQLLDSQMNLLADTSAAMIPVGEAASDGTFHLVSANHTYKVFDAGFNLLHSSALPMATYTAAGLAVDNSQAAFLSNCVSSTYTSLAGQTGRFTGVTVFPKMQSWQYPKNIGVQSVTSNTSYVSAQHVPSGSVTLLHAHFNLACVVKNYGSVPVSGFYLNCGLAYADPWQCGPEYFHRYYSGTTIAPGGTVLVQTGAFTVPWIDEIQGVAIPPGYQLPQVKMYTTLPDRELDGNTADDAAGISLSVTVTQIRENAQTAPALFPNPADRQLTVSGITGDSSIEFYGIDGRLLKALSLNEPGRVDVSDLSPGLYIVVLRTGDDALVRRIVKL